jgi:hypothetical protein
MHDQPPLAQGKSSRTPFWLFAGPEVLGEKFSPMRRGCCSVA